ncbi:MAG TPA: nucleotidyltransferase [Chitinophagaceae bacterium]|nr:nucleotidyltransferase [Chitinophagaceae bacterium]
MQDLFKNYELQREELLARIAESLQLDDTRKKRMEDAYQSISRLLNEDAGFFKDIDVDVYPQGSTAIGTTVKPLSGNEFDLDIVVHIKRLFIYYTPAEIYNALLKILSGDGRYKEKIEQKNRCVRLNYAGDFHMDILPGCIHLSGDAQKIKVPDRQRKDWTSTSPRGFIEWFMRIANSVVQPVLKGYYNSLLASVKLRAEVEDLPKDEFYSKTPLQRAVQLIKRYRDIYFLDKPEFITSSIVLTTLMASHYRGENSIYLTIENVVARVINEYNEAIRLHQRFKVYNPVNNEEVFTDSWTGKHYDVFYAFITDFYGKWITLKGGFEKSGHEYIKLFGEGIYKESLQGQIKQMARFTTDTTTKANSLIITSSAYTDSKGQINTNNGYKNEYHRNHGG